MKAATGASALLALFVVALAGGPARANSTTDCYFTIGKWGPASTTVDVWANNSATNGLQNLGISIADADHAVRQAVSIWNEQSGGRLRLRYRGQTDVQAIGGALTVTYFPTPDPFGNAAGRTWIFRSQSVPTLITNGIIALYQGYTWETGGDSDYQRWTVFPPYQKLRFLPIMVHELGHAAFQIVHPGEEGRVDDGSQNGAPVQCTDMGQATVMSGLAYGLPTWPYRSLRAWDKLQAQGRMGGRGTSSRILHRKWIGGAGNGSWASPLSFARNALYRMASSSQQRTDERALLGWLRQGNPLNPGNVIRTEIARAGSLSPGQSISSGILSPVAVASTPEGVSIMAYAAHEEPDTGLRRICYRTSPDGITFGGETCLRDLADDHFVTHRDTVTAAYDPFSKAFLVGAIVEWGLVDSEPNPRLFIQTLPVAGSTTPQRFTLLDTDRRSFNAPSIACRKAKQGCRVFYQDRSLHGSLRWVEAEVDTSTGHVVAGPIRSANLDQFDTPNVVWSEAEGRYRIAFVQDNSLVQAFAMGPTGASLVRLADMSNGKTFVSAPVQSTTACSPSPCASETIGWLVEWW